MGICEKITGNPNEGKACNPGTKAVIILFEAKPTAIAEATARLLATWDAYILNDKPNVHCRFQQKKLFELFQHHLYKH